MCIRIWLAVGMASPLFFGGLVYFGRVAESLLNLLGIIFGLSCFIVLLQLLLKREAVGPGRLQQYSKYKLYGIGFVTQLISMMAVGVAFMIGEQVVNRFFGGGEAYLALFVVCGALLVLMPTVILRSAPGAVEVSSPTSPRSSPPN